MKNKIECEKAVGEICEMCFEKHELEYGHQPVNCAFREFDNEDCPTVKVLKDLIQSILMERMMRFNGNKRRIHKSVKRYGRSI